MEELTGSLMENLQPKGLMAHSSLLTSRAKIHELKIFGVSRIVATSWPLLWSSRHSCDTKKKVHFLECFPALHGFLTMVA